MTAPTAAPRPQTARPVPEEAEAFEAWPWAVLRNAGPRAVLGAVTKAVQPTAAMAATATCWVEGAILFSSRTKPQALHSSGCLSQNGCWMLRIPILCPVAVTR